MKKSSQVPLERDSGEEFVRRVKALTMKQIASFLLWFSIGLGLGLVMVYFITGEDGIPGRTDKTIPSIGNTTPPPGWEDVLNGTD